MEHGAVVCDQESLGIEISWKQELEIYQSQVDNLRDRLLELKVGIQCTEDDSKSELDLLWCKVGTISTLLTYLKSKARNVEVMQLAHCTVTKHGDGVKLINEHTATVPDCFNDGNLFNSLENRYKKVSLRNNFKLKSIEANDRPYIAELLKSVSMMTDVVESLVKRVIIAEAEVANEKGKVNLGLTELKRKTLQIERMSAKVKEMENFAACTNDRLNEMKQKVEHMVQETSRQKQHAAENERELARVKQDFETLKSYVNHLIQSREEVTSSDSQFQEREVLDRLLEKNSRLENERMLKESEVQKLMEDNVRLRNLLDKKEAQLLAMNEQCKFMALKKP